MKRLLVRALTLIAIGSVTYYVYGIYQKTHVVVMHNSPSLGKEESNYDFISLLKGVRNGTYKTYYPNGQLREEFIIVNGRKNGPSKTFFENGALRSEDNYKDDRLDGEIKRYEYATGFFFSVNHYKDGFLDGINKWYYPSGAVRSEEEYAMGLKNGPTKFYKEDGKLEKIVTYTANQMTGLSTYYYPDGATVESKINYLNGEYDGEAAWYFDNGKMSFLYHFKAGKQDGLYKMFYDSGITAEEKEYRDDQEHGSVKTYYPSGQLKLESHFESGKYHGESKKYYPNGRLQSVSHDSFGQPQGNITLYSEDGQILLDLIMDNGRIQQILTDNILLNPTLNDAINLSKGAHFTIINWFLLHSRQFDKLEKLAELINSSPDNCTTIFNDFMYGLSFSFGAVTVAETPVEFISLLDEWKKAYPQSVTQYMVRINALIDIAWNFRGGNFADATTRASFERFEKSLLEAEHIVQEALGLPQKHPYLYSQWITISMGLNQPDAATEQIFQQGIAVDKLYFRLYSKRLVTLLPKWGGRKEQVLKFIDTSIKNLNGTDGQLLYGYLINSFFDYEGNNFLLEYNLDRDQMLDNYLYFVSRYPEQRLYKNRLAWLAVQFGNKKYAATAFQMIDQDDYEYHVWVYKDFRAARRWAASEGNNTIVSDIHNAVTKGDMVSLYLYLKNNGDLNITEKSYKRTLLMTALHARHPEVAEYLINAGADVNKTDIYNETPLHAAADHGYAFLVQLLLDKKIIVKKLSNKNLTPLHKAALGGYTAIGSMLLNADRSILKQKSKSGRTALLAACENAQTNFVKMLMAYKELDLAEADNDGYNCMHLAVSKGAEDLVKLLLQTDVDYLQQKNSQGETALDMAVKADYTEIIRLLKVNLPAPDETPAPTEPVTPAL